MINYCSIEDAWGHNISKQYKDYMSNTRSDKHIVENFESDNLSECDKFMHHFKSCEKCQDKLRKLLQPKLLNSIKKFIDNNNDIIILILIGIAILLFFNLLNNLTK